MTCSYFFADEAGCFTFNRNHNVSIYFLLCTVHMNSCEVGNALLHLRRDMQWREFPLLDYFHASEDRQIVRDEVFETICKHDFTVQATVMKKPKAQPQVRRSKARFYKIGWYFHFKHGAGKLVDPKGETLVVAASIGNKREKLSFRNAVHDVLDQTVPAEQWQAAFTPCNADSCLQVADYCAWAIQRKWERNDTKSYDLIKDRITYEYDLWSHGTEEFY